ncbi:MAG: hypothetical protein LC677_01115 [Halomonas sp.]|nr:hypothetical protein [Halomonas sp.]
MQLVIISGRSGSGKSIALQALEDLGYYAIDNLPAMLLDSLVDELRDQGDRTHLAVSIDARNLPGALAKLPELLEELRLRTIKCQIVYLTTDARILLERYSATRRRHPLTRNSNLTLEEAIDKEEQTLHEIRDLADLTIDTTRLSVHDLRRRITDQVAHQRRDQLTLTFESFGYKRGNWAKYSYATASWVCNIRSTRRFSSNSLKNILYREDPNSQKEPGCQNVDLPSLTNAVSTQGPPRSLCSAVSNSTPTYAFSNSSRKLMLPTSWRF